MKIPKKIRTSSKCENRKLSDRMVKLTEEVGELAAEVSKYKGLKGSKGKTKQEILDDLRLEAVDVMIMAMEMLCFTETSDDQINNIMDSQLNKWNRTKGL